MRFSPAESLDEFVRAHTGKLLQTAFLITWDEAEAEDLVQECLLRVSKRWRRVEGMDTPVAYARRILVNLALAGRGRRDRRRMELNGPQPHQGRRDAREEPVDLSTDPSFESLVQRSELVDALGHLTPQQRTVLVLRYFEDLSETQVADLLGCSTGTVKSSASRGMARLRVLLGPASSDSEVVSYE